MNAGAARLAATAGRIQSDKGEEAADRQGAGAVGQVIGEGSRMRKQHDALLIG